MFDRNRVGNASRMNLTKKSLRVSVCPINRGCSIGVINNRKLLKIWNNYVDGGF